MRACATDEEMAVENQGTQEPAEASRPEVSAFRALVVTSTATGTVVDDVLVLDVVVGAVVVAPAPCPDTTTAVIKVLTTAMMQRERHVITCFPASPPEITMPALPFQSAIGCSARP